MNGIDIDSFRFFIIPSFCFILGCLTAVFLIDFLKSRSARRRIKSGRKAEKKGRKILERAGYRIVSVQPEVMTRYYVDGNPVKYKIKTDYLVKKGLAYYAAEVKSGGAVEFNNINTRRQLLEYDFNYRVKGLLLVDADSRTIHAVNFKRKKLLPVIKILLVMLTLILLLIFLFNDIGLKKSAAIDSISLENECL